MQQLSVTHKKCCRCAVMYNMIQQEPLPRWAVAFIVTSTVRNITTQRTVQLKHRKNQNNLSHFCSIGLIVTAHLSIFLIRKRIQKKDLKEFHIKINHNIEHAKSHFSHLSQFSLKSHTAFCWSISVLIWVISNMWHGGCTVVGNTLS